MGLAGEYRVASELIRRGLFTTITYGNNKGTDLYAIGPNRKSAVIEVKTSRNGRFVTGFYQKYRTAGTVHPDFWVLYWLTEDEQDRFFVLTHAELATVQARRNSPSKQKTWEELTIAAKLGVDNVSHSHVAGFESNWKKILTKCGVATSIVIR